MELDGEACLPRWSQTRGEGRKARRWCQMDAFLVVGVAVGRAEASRA